MLKMKKNQIIVLIVLLFAAILTFTGCSVDTGVINKDYDNTVPTGNIKVHFIDVGQADSILIEQGKHGMLIDAGNNVEGELVCHYIKSQNIKKLDYVVGTPPLMQII